MGQNESLSPLPEDQKEISYPNEKLSQLKFFIPEKHPLESADLPGNQIRFFPPVLHRLKYLDLSRNSLSEIDFSELDVRYDSLEILRLSSNNLQELPKSLVESFGNLENLALDSNELSEKTTNFTKFGNLKNLDLFLNVYAAMPQLPDSLVTLNIGFNQIRSISFHAANLTELRIAGNEMTEFSTGCSFPRLVTLDLSMNRLVFLPPISSFAPSIEKLNCSYNFLVGLASLPPSVTHLDISHNCFESVTFENLNQLNTVDLSFNKIRVLAKLPSSIEHFNGEHNLIETSAPLSVKQLNTLQINSNRFTEIPNFKDSVIGVFIMRCNKVTHLDPQRLFPGVKRVDVTDNLINELPPELFELHKIQFLNVTLNKLREIPPMITGLNLTSLFISENSEISNLPDLPQCLITLVASKCNFKAIPASVFKVSRLSSLDLSCNHIVELPVLPNVHQINLSMNMIEKLPKVPDNVSNLDLAHNCLKSVELQGDFIMIQEINISHNKLKSFNTPKLPILHTLKINHNKNLKFSINYANFPSLRVLDLTMTKVNPPLPLAQTLKELSTSNQQFFLNAKSPVVRMYSCKNVGYSEICGTRPTMEDTLIIRRDILPNLDMYAVIDGHAGVETATLAAYYIPLFFLTSPNKSIGGISSVFRKVHKKINEHIVKDGATIALAIVSPSEIGIAHLGDARALVVKKDKTVVTLTYDHKPTDRGEIDLIKENRSFVDSNRTAGILAVSRSLGDFYIPGVSHVPDMTSYERHKTDYRLVIGCDGVFDVIDNQDIGEIISQVKDVNEAACLLRNTAFARGSQDNISVIVVDIVLDK